jgi:hypothetical protein
MLLLFYFAARLAATILNATLALVKERKKITWRHAQNVVSLWEHCTNFNSTLVICLKFVFIEMLDKLITCKVCWYKTLYQIWPVAWTNCITTRRYATRSDPGSHNRLDLMQSLVSPHYVCNGYISWRSVLLVEETGVTGQNLRPATSHWQTLSHKVV